MTGDHGGHDAGDVGYNHHDARDQHFLVFFVLTKDLSIDFQHVFRDDDEEKRRKKKTRTVFSRSQVSESNIDKMLVGDSVKCNGGWTDLDDVLSKCLLFLTPFSFSRCSSWNPPLT